MVQHLCTFDLAWKGPCKKLTANEVELCPEHFGMECVSCGEQATRLCPHAGSFVCGAPLCENCTHNVILIPPPKHVRRLSKQIKKVALIHFCRNCATVLTGSIEWQNPDARCENCDLPVHEASERIIGHFDLSDTFALTNPRMTGIMEE